MSHDATSRAIQTARTLATLEGCKVVQYADKRVVFTANAAIDADGSNAQNGGKPAYNNTNTGLDHLANGGMKIAGGCVVWAASWGKDIVIVRGGMPMVLPDGTIPSKTAYRFPDKAADDPSAYVDSATVPYVVVPPIVRQLARGVVMGCKALITHTKTGKSVAAVVAEIGPRHKLGELSIAAAKALGIPSSPRHGGISENVIRYELWPGSPAVVNGVTYPLLPA